MRGRGSVEALEAGLLRRAQHLALSDRDRTAQIARQIVAAKIQNSRQVLLRAARDLADIDSASPLAMAVSYLARILDRLRTIQEFQDAGRKQLKGIKGRQRLYEVVW